MVNNKVGHVINCSKYMFKDHFIFIIYKIIYEKFINILIFSSKINYFYEILFLIYSEIYSLFKVVSHIYSEVQPLIHDFIQTLFL